MENVCQDTLNCTIDKKSGKYALIPLNIAHSNTFSIYIWKMNVFYIFFDNILAKYSPNCTILKKILVGAFSEPA